MIAETLLLDRPAICADIMPSQNSELSTIARGMGAFCLFEQQALSPQAQNDRRLNMANEAKDIDATTALDMIYPASHEACATRSLVAENGLCEKMDGTPFAVIAVEGTDPLSVAARRVEAKWFNAEFGTHPSDHELTFNEYNESSVFLLLLDMQDPNKAIPCGVIRMLKPSSKGLKTVNILSSDERDGDHIVNPWFNDFCEKIPDFANATHEERSQKIYEFFGIDRETAWDVPTMVVDAAYRGNSTSEITPAWGLHAACMNTAPALGAKSFIDTQDIAPLELMQRRFGRPWTDAKTLDSAGNKGKYAFTPVPYEGESPVVPTCLPDLYEAHKKLTLESPRAASALFDPNVYSSFFKIPAQLQPQLFKHSVAA